MQMPKKMQVSRMIYSGENNCKYFVGYRNNDYKVKTIGYI